MAKHGAKQIVLISWRRQSAAEGINRGQLHVVIKLLSKCGACSPTARGPAIVSKPGGKIILKVVSRGQITAAAEDRHVAIVVVEACDLDFPTCADFSLRRHFFVQTVLQNGTALPPKQRGKCIQFTKRCSKRTSGLRVVRLEWTGAVRQRGENERRAPIIVEAHV